MKKRYIILKGLEGFADRLQCLLQAISYCRSTRRCLVVDWRDKDWCHDSLFGFDWYFRIADIESETIESFLKYYQEIPETDRRCIPSAWSQHMFRVDFHSLIRLDEYQLPGKGLCIEEITSGKREDFGEDFVVYPGVGPRTYCYSEAKSLFLTDEANKEIFGIISRIRLTKKEDYDIVHLRGGSKIWAGGKMRKGSAVYDLHNKWRSADEYMQEIYEVYCCMTANGDTKQLYIITDTPILSTAWIQKYKLGRILPAISPNKLKECGIHKLQSNDLEDSGLTKHDLNLECIKDFILMQRCRILVGDGVSGFSLMAFHLKNNHVDWFKPLNQPIYLM